MLQILAIMVELVSISTMDFSVNVQIIGRVLHVQQMLMNVQGLQEQILDVKMVHDVKISLELTRNTPSLSDKRVNFRRKRSC